MANRVEPALPRSAIRDTAILDTLAQVTTGEAVGTLTAVKCVAYWIESALPRSTVGNAPFDVGIAVGVAVCVDVAVEITVPASATIADAPTRTFGVAGLNALATA